MLQRVVSTEQPEAEKDWSKHPEKLTLLALGTNNFLGQLYDARTNTYYPKSLFSSALSPELVKVQANNKVKIKNIFDDSLSSRFELLQVPLEQQLSILASSSPLTGHAKFLTEETECETTISSSLLFKLSTKTKKIAAPFDSLEPYIDKNIFQEVQYTHVVVEIDWGIISILTMQHLDSDLAKKDDIKRFLKAEIDRVTLLLKSNSSAYVNVGNSDDSLKRNLRLKFCSDILPRKNATADVKSAFDFLSKLSVSIKSVSSGDGVPLSYVMIPISTFFKSKEAPLPMALKQIDQIFATTIISLFEEILKLKEAANDREKDVLKYEDYFPDQTIEKVKNVQDEIKKVQTQLRAVLTAKFPQLKSGNADFEKFAKKIEKYKEPDGILEKIKEDIKNLNTRETRDYLEICMSKKVIYLGKKENLEEVMSRKKHINSYVLFTSEELINRDFETSETSEKTFDLFLSMADNPETNSQYIIVDFDVNTVVQYEASDLKIMKYKDGKIISDDVLRDKNMNFAKIRNPKNLNSVECRPITRIELELQCPGHRSNKCSQDPIKWHCSECREILEFGFDNFFYCACGKAESQCFAFKCSSPTHGDSYLQVKESNTLRNTLQQLKPPDEMNILILGQSGVGKSTWINSIVNYLQYDTLEDAENGGVICTIPASFITTYTIDQTVMKQVVQVGDEDDNEITAVGKSATRGPKTYHFTLDGKIVRLIDTPGLGDTEGIDRDKENMQKILHQISFFRDIHGICILLKSNETRIDAIFRFCIQELLCHLHRNAAKNIIFCFTNSRSSFYSPGDTSDVLAKLLKEQKLDDLIVMSRKTMFCLDNESFRYLCTLKYDNIPQSDEKRKIYSRSWVKSVTETKKLIQQIKELEPHSVSDTTTLCNARLRVLNLMKPVAEITQTIQLNLVAIAEQERKIANSNENLDDLAQKLYVPQIVLEPEVLPYPRTVCTSKKCTKDYYLEQTNVTMVEYEKICHDMCYLSGITTEKYPNTEIRQCHIFNYDPQRSICIECMCPWDQHMHITYNQKRVEKDFINLRVENEMNDTKNSKAKIEEHKKHLEMTTAQYKKEQDIIIQSSLKFGVFLKRKCTCSLQRRI